MESKRYILVPSFEPPKSSYLLKASFSQRTSLQLQMKDHSMQSSGYNNNNNSRHLFHVTDTLTTATSPLNLISLKPSSTSFDLFQGSITYTSYPHVNEKRTAPQHTISVENMRKRPKLSSVPSTVTISDKRQTKVDKRPQKTSTASPTRTSLRKAVVPITHLKPVRTSLTETSFSLSVDGIERFCRNVGASSEALDAFESLCNASDAFSFALIFLDGTTTHVETCVKFCVPSKPCYQWYCACDRHIRARHGVSPLSVLGAAICIAGQEEFVYFLSLTNSLDSMINCSSSLEQRWSKLFDILSTNSSDDSGRETVSHKVMFNVQIGLMPLLHKLKSSNQKFVNMLSNNNNNMFDIKVASHLCDSNLSEEELEFQAISDRCGARATHQKNGAGTRSGSVTKVLFQLHGELQCLLKMRHTLETDLREKKMLDCFYHIEMPIAKQLSSMEFNGIRVISASKFGTMRTELRNFVCDLEDKAERCLSGNNYPKPFNLSSPEQVAHVLFTVLKLDSRIPMMAAATNSSSSGKTKAGKHQSTSEEDLMRIQEHHPLVPIILAHRHVSKVLHTFVEGLISFIAEDGSSPLPAARSNHKSSLLEPLVLPPTSPPERRVYASWNQTSTRTGRFSCQKPNLQAFPNPKRLHSMVAGAVDTNVRNIFTASTGNVLISADYSQIEMRVLAHMCGDVAMLSLFNRSEGDIYETLARIILNKKEIDDVSSVERERAKVICLGTMYGMGLPAAAAKLKISHQVAQNIVSSFYLKFKNVKLWIQFIKSDAKKKGYVATISGRKRFLPDINSPDTKKRSQAERQAVNSVIQGSASDVIKYAMLSVEKAIDAHSLFGNSPYYEGKSVPTRAPLNPVRPTLISQIHDEVIYDVPLHSTYAAGMPYANDSHVQEFIYLLRDSLENSTGRGLGIKVPLLVKVAVGETWGNMTPCNCVDTKPLLGSLHASCLRVAKVTSSMTQFQSHPIVSLLSDKALRKTKSPLPNLAERCNDEVENCHFAGQEDGDTGSHTNNLDGSGDAVTSIFSLTSMGPLAPSPHTLMQSAVRSLQQSSCQQYSHPLDQSDLSTTIPDLSTPTPVSSASASAPSSSSYKATGPALWNHPPHSIPPNEAQHHQDHTPRRCSGESGRRSID